MTEIITALYHAASSEELDTMDGAPACATTTSAQRRARQARRALVDTVGDEVDVDSYGVAMECQGFVNGFKLALGLCVEVI